ncbi:type II-A CRISPR-associated protein Csn2 [Companilactobacillus hulinensis]|uniref:type II-A CRISPR-associated protein Csn2 n=1 Tax=Companilactobacillus hulinensis TaxID=2486007 RepID=UPI000F77F252|nr:type II-A CRISPR-associated protein Csn2 [Companilactobacillus hulinensis]
MNDKCITVFPYDPFPINNGITFINFQNKYEYSQLLFNLNLLKNHETFSDDVDQFIHFYLNDSDKLKDSLKELAIIGDITSFDINSTANIKSVFKTIVNDSYTINREKIESINEQINGLFFDMISIYDESFDFDLTEELIKLLKYKSIRVDTSIWNNYYDKIHSVITFYSDFSEKKTLLFHGLEHFINIEQLNELNNYLKSIGLNVISLESYPMTKKESTLEIKIYSIDDDHIRFDY